MSKHTPGPWVAQTDELLSGTEFVGVYADGATGDHLRCQVLGNNAEADAQLIAAAPSLLEAAVDILEALERNIPSHQGEWNIADAHHLDAEVENLRDAIKAAQS